MSLDLPTSGGDFTPFIKYNAKAGRFYIREGDQDQEVVNPTLIIDMANIKTGWINFPLSGPPQTAWNTEAPPEGDRWKRGFKVVVNGEPPVGEREWMSNAIVCNAAMVKMHAMWEGAPEHADITKAPWYRFIRVEGITGQYGTNYEPVFELAGFADRAGRFSDANGQLAPGPGQAPTQKESDGLTNEAISSFADPPF